MTSTLATGTAPLAVASTTVNTNLNADTVDGDHRVDLMGATMQSASAAAFTVTAGAGVFETDTTLTVGITTGTTCDIVAMCSGTFYSDTIRTLAAKFTLYLNDTTESPTITLAYGVDTVSTREGFSVVSRWAGIAAGTHTVKLRVARANASDTVVVALRQINIIAVPV